MPEILISVTEASRNFAECVNRVRYQGASFLLQKNGTPVARLVPVEFEGTDEPERLAARDKAGSSKPDNDAERLTGKPAGYDVLNW